MCRIATLIKSAPANVDPIILNFGFVLKAWERIGKVPTTQTMTKKIIINKTLSKEVRISNSISIWS